MKRDVAEKHPEAHEREGGREPHHDHDHDEAQHQEPERGVAHVCRSPPMPRWRAASSMAFARSIATLRDSSSTYSLCASCSSMTSVSATSLSRLAHSPVLRQTTQRTISAMPWIITMTPASGIMNLNCQTGGPSAVTVECSSIHQDSTAKIQPE